VSRAPQCISRRVALDALNQGIAAADAGEPVHACPYQSTGDDMAQEFAAHWWIKGWRRGRPEPVHA
jgi:ribosome modulation factor